MSDVIEVEGLRKEYRRVRRAPAVALAGIDLAVPEGGVFGFLGPNGSGKTTTIRCLLGLVRPTEGRTAVMGLDTPRNLPKVLEHVGAIVESPALFPTMTGRENLRLLGAIAGIGHRRVDEVLGQVGLGERGGDKVRTYSLGMRQRLGLAAALLKDPALLVLDEPANGLDPAGIREIRELLRRLGAEGRTVFVSSHQLAEVEQICDRVAILDRGRCVLTGRVDEVLEEWSAPALLVGLPDLMGGIEVLTAAGYVVERVGTRLRVGATRSEAGRVTEALAVRGHFVTELRAEEASLEDMFLELTAHTEEVAA